MNYASEEQLIAVAENCRDYTNLSNMQNYDEEISCQSCSNWKNDICVIDVFDNVLTSLDQT